MRHKMSEYDSMAKANLLKLLSLDLGKEIEYDDFRMAVEEIYNFRLDHRLLSKEELEAIEILFNAVARYSPFPHDREAYPTIYKDEGQIDAVVREVRSKLGVNRE
jgi:hypothetical protein